MHATHHESKLAADETLRTRVTLIQRLRVQQDEQAWREFSAHYQGYIQRVARRMGLSHHDAQEVMQNVCLRAWKTLPTFTYDPARGRFRNWLWQVTANEVRMLWRSRQHEPPLLADAADGDGLDQVPDPAVAPVETWAEDEWRVHVTTVAWQRVRGEFETRTQQVFERLSKGEEPQAVAAALGLAPDTIRVYRKRVQDRLRAEIRRLNELLD